MKDMKIAIKDEQHSKDVQEALFKEGYFRIGGSDPVWNETSFIFTYKAGEMTRTEDGYHFEHHSNPEHFLLDGKIVTKEEYETAKKDWEEWMDAGLKIRDASGAVVFDGTISGEVIRQCTIGTERPPLGLRPRPVVNALRIREVIDAIQRYVYADKVVPEEWLDELRDVNYILDIEQQQKAKKPIAGENESWRVD